MAWFYVAIALPIVLGLLGGLVGFTTEHPSGYGDWVDTLFATGIGMFVGGLVGFLLGIAPFSYSQTHFNERTLTCKVEDKDRTGEGDMRIYTSCGVFINADSVWRGKHNSADWWSKWKEGEEYEFTVAGWRLGVTSDFPNIFAWSEATK